MAHFAKVADGKVVNVIVAEPDFFDTFVDDSPGQWLQCSYNTRGGIHYQPNSDIPSEDQSKALRKNFPGVGYLYDAEADAFHEPPPPDWPSWTLNQDTFIWEAPLPYPDDGKLYRWDEDTVSWLLIDPQP